MRTNTLETAAYRSGFSSGVLEVMGGVALIVMGLVWLAGQVVFAALVPGLMLALWPVVRQRVLLPRTGVVHHRVERRRRLATGHWVLLVLGVAALALGVWVTPGALEAGSIAWVAALPAGILATAILSASIAFDLPRLLWWSVVLAVAGVVAALWDLDPGWSLLGAGAVIVVVGVGALVAFLRVTPRIEDGA